jgi:short-subunit dehydrogenase
LRDFSNPTPISLFLSLDGKSHAAKDDASTEKTQGAYVTRVSEAIRAELRGTGITVLRFARTGLHGFHRSRGPSRRQTRPRLRIVHVSLDEVARTGLAAIENDRQLVIPGLIMKLGMSLVRLMPL